MELPDDNPKTASAMKKAPIHLVPPIGVVHAAWAFMYGAIKYGPFNWRKKKITSSVYYDAMQRHLAAWWDGEDVDPDSGAHPLGHLIACATMILDAKGVKMLNDDRPPPGSTRQLLDEFEARCSGSS
jgi:hypothetical protein